MIDLWRRPSSARSPRQRKQAKQIEATRKARLEYSAELAEQIFGLIVDGRTTPATPTAMQTMNSLSMAQLDRR
jgi:hypothetical protein